MAKFRDSTSQGIGTLNAEELPLPSSDRSIGSIIAETRNLSAEQVEKVLEHQKKHGIRFGEAAIALGFASADDVLFALAQQFHYPYAAEPQRKLNPELVALNQPFGVQAEAFLAIRSQIMMRLFSDRDDRRVRAPEDVVTALGLPVLGRLPKPSSKRFLGGRQALELKQRVIGLPAPRSL